MLSADSRQSILAAGRASLLRSSPSWSISASSPSLSKGPESSSLEQSTVFHNETKSKTASSMYRRPQNDFPACSRHSYFGVAYRAGAVPFLVRPVQFGTKSNHSGPCQFMTCVSSVRSLRPPNHLRQVHIEVVLDHFWSLPALLCQSHTRAPQVLCGQSSNSHCEPAANDERGRPDGPFPSR